MKNSNLSRREFQCLTVAALGGAMAGAGLHGRAFAAEEKNRLLEEPHVCRGINTCKGLGAGKDNACAGQGACTSVKAHGCGGQNACKGQGGCGAHPGENACKGMGDCNVPLDDAAWTKARQRFEELMTKAGKKFGAAPKKK